MPASPPAPPIAIVGLGCLFPQAGDARRFWSNLVHGVDAIRDVPSSHWRREDYFDADPKRPDHTYAAKGGFLDSVDFPLMEFGVAPSTLEAIDTTQLLGLMVAQAALADAGLQNKSFDRSKASVILGITGTLPLVIPLGARLGHPQWRRALAEAGAPPAMADDILKRLAASYVPWQEDSFPGLLGNVVAGRIANRLNLGGTNCVVDAACASSLSALHLGLLELAAGRSDLVVSGGFDTFNDIFMYMCFSKTPALSPTGHARPFAADADGTTLGEGLGCMILKRLADAERDGDRVYAVIKGLGSSSDGKGQAIYAPCPEGQARALRAAYADAGVEPGSVGMVEAHGTGTRAGDLAELNGLLSVYRGARREARWCALGSVKSQIGHAKAAAGAAGLIKAALALHHKALPPTLKAKEPLEPLRAADSPFYLPNEARPWLGGDAPRRAAVSSFGFGGSNFHVVLEEHRSAKSETAWDGRVELLPFSAATLPELKEGVAKFEAGPKWETTQRAAAEARLAFRSADEFRLVFVLEQDQSGFTKLRERALGLLTDQPNAPRWGAPEGIYYGRGPAPGPIALLFPGQGSQRVGMLRQLPLVFPEAFATLEQAQAASQSPTPLGDLIYPPTACGDDERRCQEEALRMTEHAQPALAAASLGAFQTLQRFGVPFAACAGHSFGEWTALAAAGRIGPAELHRAAAERGKQMAEAAARQPGAMAAVAAGADEVQGLLSQGAYGLAIANRNGPKQTVVAGAAAELDRFCQAASAQPWQCVRLPVAAAFHTPAMRDAQPAFRAFLADLPFFPGAAPVVSATTGSPFPEDAAAAREVLVRQLAERIDFGAAVKELWRLGCRTFVEVGPGTVLTRLVGGILVDRSAQAMALEASSGRRSSIFDLGRCLAELAALGYPLALNRWQEGFLAAVHKPAFSVPLSGSNYVQARPPLPPAVLDSPPPAPMSPAPEVPASAVRPPLDRPETKAISSSVPPQPKTPTATMPNNDLLAALVRLAETQADVQKRYLEAHERTLSLFQALAGGLAAAPPLPALPAPSSNGHGHHESAHQCVQDAPPARLGQPAGGAEELKSRLGAYNAAAHANGAAPRRDGAVRLAAPPATQAKPVAEARPTSAPAPVELLRRIIAEKTGYPAEALELDLELDADLGIDSIKRVEILAAVQEALPNAPTIQPEQVGTLRTLRALASHLGQAAAPSAGASKAAHPDAAAILRQIVAEKTGYPPEALEPHLQLDADLGIDSIKRVEIFAAVQERLPQASPIGPEEVGKLRTLADVARHLAPQTEVAVASNGHSQAAAVEVGAAAAFF